MAEGYKDWSAGNTLTAADLEDYTVKQSIMRFASASARNSALASVLDEGMMAWLDDTNTLTVYTGSAWSTVGPLHGAWTAYTPSWTSAGGTPPAIGNGALEGAYQRIGRTVHFRARASFGTTSTFGSGGNSWRISVPFASSATIWAQPVIQLYSATGALPISATRSWVDTNVSYVVTNIDNTTAAWGSGGYVIVHGTYECGADA